MHIVRGLLGIVLLLGIATLLSRHRRSIDWRLVGIGVVLQIVFGVLITQVSWITDAFNVLSRGFVVLLSFAADGARFLFSGLAVNSYNDPESAGHSMGVIFAFQVLPTVIFFSTVSAGLYYLGILQKIVFGIAWVMAKTMRLSGAESLSAAGNIFLGQTEAPLLVRPFVPRMTRSELMCLMTGGMATIAGGVLAAYVSFLGGNSIEEQTRFAAYLLSASIMNAPAGIVMAKIFVPEEHPESIDHELKVNKDTLGVNLIDALSNGAAEGLKLALNIGGMLLAFIAIIAMLNYMLSDMLGNWLGLNAWVARTTGGVFQEFSLEYLLGLLFRPLAFIMGVDWKDTLTVGSLLGQKTAINEFIAYASLADLKAAGQLAPRSVVIATFALCGFSNFSSIAIQIGGIGGMAPNQQGTLSKLGLWALAAATLACMMTATVAGMLLG
ncbi:concentrative nucleoside transporter, CNT family [Catalinimonas alkaloidigena]|uniref:Concentrative nucleoside transporter, CNT family n=1 Tax=Catalinimonas alkaloidigena TaxID=1075417 RepID=A0A1G9RIV3_9BACT|nr:nucleoside transporter C-terminal domain-containing protein [Catalinimonas alkaloidigena]SDM22797.1 concentrative nucleoside transporter, CNT family [Catalinimonas alkaloidigena]